MNMRFAGQVAVIAGGADGLGKGIAKRIASEGGRIVLLDIDPNRLESAVSEFKGEGFEAEGYPVDVADEHSVEKAFKAAEESCGKIDIVVNSAGIVGLTNTKITDYTTSAFDQIYGVNLRGTFLVCKYAVKAMEKNNYGRVLLIA